MLTFTVLGVAAPKGSTKAFYVAKLGRAVTTADNRRSAPWQESVVAAAQVALDGALPLDGPVGLALSFYLPRPKSAPKRITEPAKLPDLDKLVRALGDALTAAGVWHDDAQVVRVLARKAFAGGIHDPEGASGVPRAHITVEAVEP